MDRFRFALSKRAKGKGYRVVAVCHRGETDPTIEDLADKVVWIRVGELGRIISTFREAGAREVAMAGGISRIKLFGGTKLDARGALLLAKLRSVKDDIIMRGVADELTREGIEVIPCTRFMESALAETGVLTKAKPTREEEEDIEVGRAAIAAMSSQHIGQLVVVREGVVTAVEAVEGSDAAIRRGGELGGKGSVVVKFAKSTQDMRFDVPTVGVRTIEVMHEVRARVLALESGRCLMMDREEMIQLANKHRIVVVGCRPLISDEQDNSSSLDV